MKPTDEEAKADHEKKIDEAIAAAKKAGSTVIPLPGAVCYLFKNNFIFYMQFTNAAIQSAEEKAPAPVEPEVPEPRVSINNYK